MTPTPPRNSDTLAVQPPGAVSWKIHPPIGIARVGNSPSAFLLDSDCWNGAPAQARRDSGDADNLFLPRVKRQGASFRVFAYDAAGGCLGEVRAGSVRSIQWTVCLANRKGAGPCIGGRPGAARQRLRNKDVPGGERWRLEISPKPRHLDGPNRRAVFDDGRFMDIPVCLGEIRTDAENRLIVLGGHGKAGTCDAAKRIRSPANNDGWYDDISDGPVSATITLLNGTIVDAAPSWVIVAPPDFAPGIPGVITLFDVLLDRAVRHRFLPPPRRPSFQRDIAPILRRIASMQWLDRRALLDFGDVPGGFDILSNWAALAHNGPDSKPMREGVFATVAKHHARAGGWLKLSQTQYDTLALWAAGAFRADRRAAASSPRRAAANARSADEIDRAVLEGCSGGVLPADTGCFMAGDPFRLDHEKLAAGAMTQSTPCPWQAGFLETGPAPSRPYEVLTAETYAAVRDLDEQIATLAADGSQHEQGRLLRDRRDALWVKREPWARGLAAAFPARAESLVKEWQHLGFLATHGPDGEGFARAGSPCFVEAERNSCLGTMADYFHRLVNIESHRDFAPKAIELALAMLEDAKFSADWKFTPFRYTPEAFDKHLEKIYADFVETMMYQPVRWESGEIYWDAIVDYDEDDEPVWRERLFHVGRFSDRALAERFRQFGPLNLTDGAWLQNILPAGPVEEVRSRLFTIWLDEAGNGRSELNHSNVYDTLLRSLNIYMPPVTSRAFVEQDLVRSSFESSVFQLCVGLFPRRFLPELLGMTLFVEWEATPTMEPIARMMAARRIDPQYYRMHAAIDNVDVGHGALAKEAVKLYLHDKYQEGGDAVVQEHWQRIWRGYVAWATLGNGADEVLERMMIVDKKQIHLRSSLLLTSDILPPLVLALQAYHDPVSAYLRAQLDRSTRTMLKAWNPEEPPPDTLLQGLRADLNACLRKGIHDEARWAGVALSAGTRALLRLAPRNGVDLIDLSRSLLEDAYPDGIARRAGFPDIKAHYAARMADLIRRKTPVALQSHRHKPWLMNAFRGKPEDLMQALISRGLIDIEHPARSSFFDRLAFSGPMYKVFTDEERVTIIDWIESLRADGAEVARPLPQPITMPDPVLTLLPAASAGRGDSLPTAISETGDPVPAAPGPDPSYREKRSRTGMGSVH